MIDYWRDLETGPKPPEIIYAVIENPKGTENKYEYDVEKKALVLDRVLYSAVHYPGDYGFIPRTYDEDGDPLDVMVLVTNPTFPGCIMVAQPIGLLHMLDSYKKDDKILAVPVGDSRYTEYHNLDDVPQHTLTEIAYLFETYKVLEGKPVKVLGWEDAEAAKAVIKHCQKLYQERL
ncbi:MAG: inorganic diphosphatase [Candidatus Bipolaricaulia bacterium]